MPTPASRTPLGMLIVSLTGRRTSARKSLPASSVSALVRPWTAVPAIPGSVATLIVGPWPPTASVTPMPLRRNSALRSWTACLQALVQCAPMWPRRTFTAAMVDLLYDPFSLARLVRDKLAPAPAVPAGAGAGLRGAAGAAEGQGRAGRASAGPPMVD